MNHISQDMHTLVYGLESWAKSQDKVNREDLIFLRQALVHDEQEFEAHVRLRQRKERDQNTGQEDVIPLPNGHINLPKGNIPPKHSTPKKPAAKGLEPISRVAGLSDIRASGNPIISDFNDFGDPLNPENFMPTYNTMFNALKNFRFADPKYTDDVNRQREKTKKNKENNSTHVSEKSDDEEYYSSDEDEGLCCVGLSLTGGRP